MGWERRGNHEYYYRKERDGAGGVKSKYVGRGEMARMISKFESSSREIEKLLRAKKAMEDQEFERIEAAIDRAVELGQHFTQALLLSAGFHTHRRQWRRKRKCQ